MTLRTHTRSPPSWVAMLPQKFSMATTTGCPDGQGGAGGVELPPALPHPAKRRGATIAARSPTDRPRITVDHWPPGPRTGDRPDLELTKPPPEIERTACAGVLHILLAQDDCRN